MKQINIDCVQFIINLLALGFIGLFLYMNIYSIQYNGIVIVDWNGSGEMCFEFWMLLVLFILVFGWIIYRR